MTEKPSLGSSININNIHANQTKTLFECATRLYTLLLSVVLFVSSVTIVRNIYDTDSPHETTPTPPKQTHKHMSEADERVLLCLLSGGLFERATRPALYRIPKGVRK